MIRLHRAETVVENLHNIPDRDTLDDYDRPSEGLGRKKLAFHGLTEEELQTNAVDARVLKPGQITGTHINGRLGAGAVQQLPDLDGSLPKTKVSEAGRFGPRQISVPGIGDNPDTDAGKAVDLKSFVDFRSEANGRIDNKANQGEVNDIANRVSNKITASDALQQMKRKLKPSAFK